MLTASSQSLFRRLLHSSYNPHLLTAHYGSQPATQNIDGTRKARTYHDGCVLRSLLPLNTLLTQMWPNCAIIDHTSLTPCASFLRHFGLSSPQSQFERSVPFPRPSLSEAFCMLTRSQLPALARFPYTFFCLALAVDHAILQRYTCAELFRSCWFLEIDNFSRRRRERAMEVLGPMDGE